MPPRVGCPRTKRDLLTGIPGTSLPGDARLQVDAFGVYWVSTGDLMMLRSGAVVAETIASIGSQNYTFDNDAFYFAQESAPDIAKIVRMTRDRTETTTLVEGIDTSFYHTPLVVDGDRLYFQNTDHYLASVPKTGGAAVATTVYMTARFVVDESYVYWAYTASSHPSFYRAAKSGGDAERILNDSPPAGFAWTLEGDTFFMFAEFPFGIVSLPKTGGCVRDLIMNIEGTFAVDERAIYWLESTSRSPSTDHGGLWWAPRTGGVAVQVLEDATVGSRSGSIVLTPSQVVVLTSTGTLLAVDRP